MANEQEVEQAVEQEETTAIDYDRPTEELRRDAWINKDLNELEEHPEAWKGSMITKLLFNDSGKGDHFVRQIAEVAVQEFGTDQEKMNSYVKNAVEMRNKQAVERFGEETEFVISDEVVEKRLSQGYGVRDPNASGGEIRTVYAEGGSIDNQMEQMMAEGETHTMPDGTVHPGKTHEEYEQMAKEKEPTDEEIEASQVSDEEMEDDYLDYVISMALSPKDEQYLLEALEKDPRLSTIFDSVMTTASEFTGSGPVEGPGSEVSDSIPARLSDGEFVFNAKATDEIGSDNLMSMMKEAEVNADRKQAQSGGYVETTEKKEDEKEDVEIAAASSKAKVEGTQIPLAMQDKEMQKAMMLQNPRYGIINS